MTVSLLKFRGWPLSFQRAAPANPPQEPFRLHPSEWSLLALFSAADLAMVFDVPDGFDPAHLQGLAADAPMHLPRAGGYRQAAHTVHAADGPAAHGQQPFDVARPRRGQEGPWFLAPHSASPANLVKLREPLQPEHEESGEVFGRSQELQESDVFLGGSAFTTNESENLGIIYKWLDDIMWSQSWDHSSHRQVAYKQLKELAQVSASLPSLSFGVGQALYSYFWFEENGPKIHLEAADLSVSLHDLSLRHSGCWDLSLGVGAFLGKVCHERWLFLIMLCAEVGTSLAAQRRELPRAAALLQRANQLFTELQEYPFFSFRQWQKMYDINTNSHVFPEGFRQRPVWPTSAVPFAGWLEENYPVFREELDHILNQSLFDSLYFMGHVSMTQFSGRRESWAPLNLIHNRELAVHACEAAPRSCALLQSRPEIARCHARDVGAAFARLQPGMGIKPHLWNAPPRLAAHLGLHTPPGAKMWVADQELQWAEGKAVVFDDTYIHSVAHEGSEDRYLLITWFCHPCDNMHAEVPAEDPERFCP
ncbi:unnamed protein product [Effrenium voratum]|uniref:Aspartyl/asparaginy/proline hydroxylase domain-containing protein n=1 Tax=Effrenium voratum TaxID=2562239 RepID=A0AA36HPN5_9DINO|nr:unnamed protein product [Effrenium voratum]